MRATVSIMILTLGLSACSCPDESSSTTTADQSGSRGSPVAKKSSRPDTLPLIKIMLNLEQEMQSISSGLWRHDFEQIAGSAIGLPPTRKLSRARLRPSERCSGGKISKPS